MDMVSLELTADQVTTAMSCRCAGVSMQHLYAGRDSAGKSRVQAAGRDIVAKWPLYIVDTRQTPTTLWSWARRAVAAGSQLLALDYIQLVTPDDPRASDEKRMTEASGALRDIAKYLGVPVLAISSESNTGMLRYSGNLAYDAWTHIQCVKLEDGTFTVEVLRQRFGVQIPPMSASYTNGELRVN